MGMLGTNFNVKALPVDCSDSEIQIHLSFTFSIDVEMKCSHQNCIYEGGGNCKVRFANSMMRML